ncbi:hypothetical protein Taro_035384, partial [Colocasia esculenta]|nr:hypothetical protein [Colocasia esculenta]
MFSQGALGRHPNADSVTRSLLPSVVALELSLVVTPSSSFPTSWRCMPRCFFRIEFDSAGSTGVVFGPTLVVGHGITLFRYFVVLCSRLTPLLSLGRDSLLQEFIAGRLWWRFVAPCIAGSVSYERERLFKSELRAAFLQVLGSFGSVGGGMTFGVPGGGSG